jgi:hypothetical protein
MVQAIADKKKNGFPSESSAKKIEIDPMVIKVIRSAAQKLTRESKRRFMAEVAIDLCGGNPRQTESIFGWGREIVTLGLNELRTGITCVLSYNQRGRKRSEDNDESMKSAILELAEEFSQADPDLKSSAAYASRLSAEGLYDALLEKGFPESKLPSPRTLARILEREGYRLRRVQKARPQKKFQKPTKFLKTSTD